MDFDSGEGLGPRLRGRLLLEKAKRRARSRRVAAQRGGSVGAISDRPLFGVPPRNTASHPRQAPSGTGGGAKKPLPDGKAEAFYAAGGGVGGAKRGGGR